MLFRPAPLLLAFALVPSTPGRALAAPEAPLGQDPGSSFDVPSIPATRTPDSPASSGPDRGHDDAPAAEAPVPDAVLGDPELGDLVTALPELTGPPGKAPIPAPRGARQFGEGPSHAFLRLAPWQEGGRGHGVRTDARGGLRLAPGSSRGAWLSAPTRLPLRKGRPLALRTALTGLDSHTPQDSTVRAFYRGVSPNGAQAGPWQQGGVEVGIDLRAVWAVIQILVVLTGGSGPGGPYAGGVTLAPGSIPMPQGGGVLGQGAGGPVKGGGGGSLPQGGAGARGVGGGNGNGNGGGGTWSGWTPPGSFRIIPRAEWGAASSRSNPGSHRPDRITLHHSYGPTVAQYKGAASVRSIQRFHQKDRGWADVGYHYLVGPDGAIFEGRPERTIGAHAGTRVASKPGSGNTNNVGVCVIGNYDGPDELSPQARDALAWLLGSIRRRNGIPGARRLMGHKDIRNTGCPGARLYPRMPELDAADGVP